MNTIKTKKAFGMNFTVTYDTYTPTGMKTWREISKEEEERRRPSFDPRNPLQIEVAHKGVHIHVYLHGFQKTKNPQEKGIAFITCQDKKWAVKF